MNRRIINDSTHILGVYQTISGCNAQMTPATVAVLRFHND